ncbi:MAG: tripartite tricarboxylate transporter substrate binding protein [Variibacter sp.]|nr:tripartite tricarboxylate transporter substrate binding protein [Variibacter sp.]
MRMLAILMAVFWASITGSYAQSDFPNRPIKIVVGYGPGSSTDIVSRLVAEKMQQTFGQAVIIENRPGAAGLIAAQAVARAAPDGYTLVAFNPELSGIVPALYKNPPYDAIKDFTHIGTMAYNTGWIIAAGPSLPATTFADFTKAAKNTPKLLNYGSYGVGSVPHLGFEALKAKLGINMVHVPYKGGAESYQAAVAGQVDLVAGYTFIPLVKSGSLRALAIGGSVRSPHFPELPTLAELGLGDQILGEVYVGLSGPAGLPQPVVDKLSAELKRILALPDVTEKIGKFMAATYRSPAEFTQMVQRAGDLYAPIVRSLSLNTQ